MVMINGLGAIGGPIVGAVGIRAVGPGALFVVLAVAYSIVASFAVWRTTRRAPAPEDERGTYVPLPAGVGATVWMLPESTAEELYPVEAGAILLDDDQIPYASCGTGPPLLLLTDAGADLERWTALLLALANDGLWAIVIGPRSVDEVLGALHQLELAEVSLAGYGGGLEVALELATGCPERVQALVAMGEDGTARDPVPVPVGWLPDVDLDADDAGLLADRLVDFLRHEVDAGR